MARKKSLPQSVSEPLSNQEILIAVLGALLLLTPLLSTGLTVFSGVYDQNAWVMGVSFLFAIILLVRYFFISKKSPIIIHWLDILVGGWFIWLVITTVTSYNPIDSIVGVLFRTGGLLHWLALILLYFAIRYLTPTMSRLWSYAQVGLIVSGTATALVGLLKLVFHTQEGTQLLGMLGNQNFTSYFLALTIIVTYVYWLSRKKSLVDYSLLALAIQIAAVWVANARWVYIVLLVAAVAIHLLMAKAKQIDKLKSRTLIGVWVLLAALLVGSFALGGRMHFNLSSGTLQHRISAWSLGWEASKTRPVLGWGLENYDNAFQSEFKPEFEDDRGQTSVFDRPHNFVLLHLVTTGWIGLLLFLSILGMAIVSGLRKIKSPHAVWALATVVVYIGINLLGYETIATTVVFVLALAYLGPLTPKFRTMQTSAWSQYASIGGATLLLAWLIYFVVVPWVGYQLAWRAVVTGDLNTYHKVLTYAPYLRPNLINVLLTDRYRPNTDGSPEFYTQLANYLEDNANQRVNEPGYQLVIAKAWELSDNPQRYQKIKEALIHGLALYDNENGYYWAFYANNELFLGNIDSALEALAKAKALNPGSVFTLEAESRILEGIEIIKAREGETS